MLWFRFQLSNTWNQSLNDVTRIYQSIPIQHRTLCSRLKKSNEIGRKFAIAKRSVQYLIYNSILQGTIGEAGSVAVLPQRYAPMGPGSIPSPGAVCALGFQSILASAGFLRVLRFSLLHLKLDFLNRPVSKHFMEASLKFALLGFAWFPPNVINK